MVDISVVIPKWNTEGSRIRQNALTWSGFFQGSHKATQAWHVSTLSVFGSFQEVGGVPSLGPYVRDFFNVESILGAPHFWKVTSKRPARGTFSVRRCVPACGIEPPRQLLGAGPPVLDSMPNIMPPQALPCAYLKTLQVHVTNTSGSDPKTALRALFCTYQYLEVQGGCNQDELYLYAKHNLDL